MSKLSQAEKAGTLDEGAWVYLISPGADRCPNSLHERVVEACEAGGWKAVGWSALATPGVGDAGRLFEGVSHAVEHAACVVALVGTEAETTDAELALAYSHRRPIVGLRLDAGDCPVSPVQGMLETYERARVISCESTEDCAAELRSTFSDPDFAETIRRAAGERAVSA
jgi:hypothetical protein